MEININGKAADITLESEKTVGEVLMGIQQWLSELGLFVSGLTIDGKAYGSRSMDDAFILSLENLSSLDIKTSGWADLMMEALLGLKEDLVFYESQNSEERQNSRQHWEKSAPALFFREHDPDLYQTALKTLDGVSFSPAETMALVLERIREIENPAREMAALSPLSEEIAKRLEDLPLDMQTGKDPRAAETITLFSSLVEKLFRIIVLIKYFGTDIESIEVPQMDGFEKTNLKEFITDFSAALKEIISAYENKDTILVGDLAEYELSPRLRALTSALCGIKPERRPV
ncbi:MAG: hypothetical protein FWG27_04005 [Treponema sp.]|nr:hypothetical protein [Treponema sp.]